MLALHPSKDAWVHQPSFAHRTSITTSTRLNTHSEAADAVEETENANGTLKEGLGEGVADREGVQETNEEDAAAAAEAEAAAKVCDLLILCGALISHIPISSPTSPLSSHLPQLLSLEDYEKQLEERRRNLNRAADDAALKVDMTQFKVRG